jgi:uncharacterized membrane protein (TIGR02234 family)
VIRRARLLAVVAILLPGAVGLISSTQTWVHVALRGATAADLTVAGADAVPVLAPLSLAVLALGLALSIVGVVLRYVFGALSVIAGVALAWLAVAVLAGPPLPAYAPTVTEATGLTGAGAVADLVAATSLTAWPAVALGGAVVLAAAGVYVLVTARGWSRGGRRYEAAAAPATAHGDAPGGTAHDPGRPLDAIDSWDDLSRGDDPTTGGTAR